MDASPVILVVVDDPKLREDLLSLLTRRLGADFQVLAGDAGGFPDLLQAVPEDGAGVAVAIAAHELAGTDGVRLLGQVHARYPHARRVLLVPRGQWHSQHAVRRAIVIGLVDSYLFVPWGTPEPWLYQPMAEYLAAWSLSQRPVFEVVQVVGERQHRRSHELREHLTRAQIPYGFYDADSQAGRSLLAQLDVESAVLPVVRLRTADPRTLIAPDDTDLLEALGFQTHRMELDADVVIVGAGPSGLSAAVYASSEGLRTVMLCSGIVGGQAGSSSLIRNYLGFPRGVSGSELTNRALEQAWLFGTETLAPKVATRLEVDGARRVVHTSDGSRVSARCVVIATGVSWRRLGIPAVEERVGSGTFYGAAGAEAELLANQQVVVVGGGNSAGQAAAHLAKHAAKVSVLIRRESLAHSMSQYLVSQLEATPNVTVRALHEIVDAHGDGRLEMLTLRHVRTGAQQTVPAAGLFLMIGGEPRTDWLAGTLARDEQGYLLTGAQLPADGSGRPPLYLETSVPGVFAVGDVRHGSVKRVAPSVGSGAIAVQLIHEYLAAQPD